MNSWSVLNKMIRINHPNGYESYREAIQKVAFNAVNDVDVVLFQTNNLLHLFNGAMKLNKSMNYTITMLVDACEAVCPGTTKPGEAYETCPRSYKRELYNAIRVRRPSGAFVYVRSPEEALQCLNWFLQEHNSIEARRTHKDYMKVDDKALNRMFPCVSYLPRYYSPHIVQCAPFTCKMSIISNYKSKCGTSNSQFGLSIRIMDVVKVLIKVGKLKCDVKTRTSVINNNISVYWINKIISTLNKWGVDMAANSLYVYVDTEDDFPTLAQNVKFMPLFHLNILVRICITLWGSKFAHTTANSDFIVLGELSMVGMRFTPLDRAVYTHMVPYSDSWKHIYVPISAAPHVPKDYSHKVIYVKNLSDLINRH